jgi:hypothetical protein
LIEGIIIGTAGGVISEATIGMRVESLLLLVVVEYLLLSGISEANVPLTHELPNHLINLL